MEFLKNCSTNAQAIVRSPCRMSARIFANHAQGDYEAVAYQAFSITRDTEYPTTKLPDWSPSDDIHAAEAQLRHEQHLVTQDASRPWLWHFQPTTIDAMGQDGVALPQLEGYLLHRKCPALFTLHVLTIDR
jgi:mediator of RNA polymerase II transcription subunit 13